MTPADEARERARRIAEAYEAEYTETHRAEYELTPEEERVWTEAECLVVWLVLIGAEPAPDSEGAMLARIAIVAGA